MRLYMVINNRAALGRLGQADIEPLTGAAGAARQAVERVELFGTHWLRLLPHCLCCRAAAEE